MTTIYCVFESQYGSHHLRVAFTTKKKAEAWIEQEKSGWRDYQHSYSDLYIDTCQLDPPVKRKKVSS